MKGRRVESFDDLTQGGDYFYQDDVGGKPSIWFLLPTARDETVGNPKERSVHRVASPPHVFRFCDDGSIEVRESIACGVSKGTYWHGYLDEGHEWRQV